MEIIHLEKETDFKELIKEEKILIDFFATWCGPCRMLAPVLEKAERNIKVVKVDTDKFDDLAREYGVMSIPTLVLLEKGKEVKRNIGFIDKNNLETFLK
jgi:thioredoxin 1